MSEPTPSPPREWESCVLEIRAEGPNVRTFRVSVPPWFRFAPGMWVMLHLPDDPNQNGAYSISSSPFDEGYLELTFNKVGALTGRLFALEAGAALTLKGPFGKWTFRDEGRPAVLISEGTGITPLRSMCRFALAKGLARRLTLLYAAPSAEDMPYREELAAFAEAGISVRTKLKDLEGTVTIDDVARAVDSLSEPVYYLCGPSALVKGLSEALEARGVPREQLRYEKWGDY